MLLKYWNMDCVLWILINWRLDIGNNYVDPNLFSNTGTSQAKKEKLENYKAFMFWFSLIYFSSYFVYLVTLTETEIS